MIYNFSSTHIRVLKISHTLYDSLSMQCAICRKP